MDDLFTQATPGSVVAGTVCLDELVAMGVTDVVCCPGSRSAPLAYAAARLEAHGRVRLHMRLDERAAGFLALGMAKATGRAVAVITTSGTAVANLAPAMAEARYAQAPLIALTADRPATLVGTGANQTADQVGIFGGIPLDQVRISSTDAPPDAWRAGIRRAVVTCEGRLTRRPGPVHVNVELTPPLLGEPGRISAGVPFRVDPVPPPRARLLDPGPRTVVVAGDLPPEQGRAWAEEAERARIPLLAEPSSNARRGGAAVSTYRHLLPSMASMIERVVVVGRPTLSRSVTSLLSRKDAEIIAVAAGGQWPDPGWSVSTVVESIGLGLGDPSWMALWASADRGLRARMDRAQTWSGELVASTVLGALTDADHLFLGASNTVRDADLAPIAARPPMVYANRGLAGIDGTIATACGVALGSGAPTTALIGDLTALHDIGSLARPALETGADLTVVVADDNGGSLFSTLEYGAPRGQIGELADWFERLFAVPMAVDLEQVVRGFGVPVTTVTDADGLATALARPGAGMRVVRAVLDRSSRAADEKRLAAWGREAAREAMTEGR
ncbi:MAG: 2-succinyl-5-enolpyruvyl-6-hydroxy-3-cyclohexene-1-carboxylic-acid synthase [Propionibacteriaceae bacterium]|nr:2-succinyl-5-enolpyruvyl-6-hydroxy-3-cyclohexene-1-carboxylic-acid synthase [Propionibacteriaceae bacterium]